MGRDWQGPYCELSHFFVWRVDSPHHRYLKTSTAISHECLHGPRRTTYLCYATDQQVPCAIGLCASSSTTPQWSIHDWHRTVRQHLNLNLNQTSVDSGLGVEANSTGLHDHLTQTLWIWQWDAWRLWCLLGGGTAQSICCGECGIITHVSTEIAVGTRADWRPTPLKPATIFNRLASHLRTISIA